MFEKNSESLKKNTDVKKDNITSEKNSETLKKNTNSSQELKRKIFGLLNLQGTQTDYNLLKQLAIGFVAEFDNRQNKRLQQDDLEQIIKLIEKDRNFVEKYIHTLQTPSNEAYSNEHLNTIALKSTSIQNAPPARSKTKTNYLSSNINPFKLFNNKDTKKSLVKYFKSEQLLKEYSQYLVNKKVIDSNAPTAIKYETILSLIIGKDYENFYSPEAFCQKYIDQKIKKDLQPYFLEIIQNNIDTKNSIHIAAYILKNQNSDNYKNIKRKAINNQTEKKINDSFSNLKNSVQEAGYNFARNIKSFWG